MGESGWVEAAGDHCAFEINGFVSLLNNCRIHVVYVQVLSVIILIVELRKSLLVVVF